MKRMSRTVVTSARMLHETAVQGGHRVTCWMATLTYRPEADYRSDDISKCLQNMRMWLKERGHHVRYVWKLEMTKAGKPHYHVMIWLPVKLRCPMFDKRGWWPWGMTNTIKVHAGTKYIAKYCSKGTGGHKLPKGARIYGTGGLEFKARLEIRYWNAPAIVKETFILGTNFKRVLGGFANVDTGEFVECEYEFIKMHQGGAVMVKKDLIGNIKFSWRVATRATACYPQSANN